MAKASVNERTRRQADGLRQLRRDLGLTTTVIAGRLGYETSQAYELYERARSRLALDRVPEWAEAFGVPEDEFLAALGVQVTPVKEPTLADLLEAAGMPEDERRQLLSSIAGQVLTDDERQAFVTLWRQVQAARQVRAEQPHPHRLRA